MKYIIVDHPPSQEELDAVVENSTSDIRTNLAGTKCVLKYPWPKPATFINETEYTLSEIKVELEKEEWKSEDV